MPPAVPAPKPELVPPLPPPSAKALAEKMVRIAADIDGQRHVVERAIEGEKAAAELRKNAETALVAMQTEARTVTVEWNRTIGVSK